ncbi:hypothetical protein [Armatimonas sp.]|uniref:hypothetical protein n=1 Tax=Armatimonas sp. TaxID=1872638 RepID=UPI00374DC2C2
MQPDIDALLEQGRLVQKVDDARTATDSFKLLAFLRTPLDSDVASVASFDNQKDTTESGRRSNKPRYDAAVDTLTERLRDGFRHIEGIPDFELSAADKQAALIAYGFERGILGDLKNTARVIQLGHKALAQTPQIAPPNARFPESVLTRIQEQLAIIAETAPQATTSPRQAATKQRNAAAKSLSTTLLRIRFYYACVTPDADKTPELAKIGFQPRRTSGQRLLKSETV